MSQKLEIEDFSGGVTDYYLNAPINKLRRCDNFTLVQYPGAGKPFTRPGSSLYAASQIPPGAQRISTCYLYRDIFFAQSANRLYYLSGGAWQTLLGPTGNNSFLLATTASVFTYSHWNHHTLLANSALQRPQKVYLNASTVPVLVEAGLPKAAVPTVNSSTAGGNNWLYKIVFKNTYVTKDSVTYIDYGTPSDSLLVKDVNAVNLGFPAFSNGSMDNFPTATMQREIYRTTSNGTVFYKIATVSGSAAGSWNDIETDANIQLNELLYTEGGVAANDQPPKCKLVHIFYDTAYYANILNLPFRCQQSVPGDIDAAPASFFADADEEIVVLSSTKSNLIWVCKNSVYRVDGQYDELGRGGMFPEKISDTATCISAQSVVQAEGGLFWAGFEGIYFTDGYQVMKLNGDYDKTWKEFVTTAGVSDPVKQVRIQGKFDKQKNRIFWTVQHTSVTDVDKCYVLDLNWGVRENATFYTWSGLDSFSPTAIEFDAGDLIRADRRGYVLKHLSTLYSDVKIDVAVSPASWVRQTIFYDLETAAFNFGTSFLRKYVTGINIVADSVTNLSLTITSNNDDDKNVAPLLPIRYRGNVVWGDPDVYWGDPSVTWNQDGLILEKRRMPARSLRCSYKSVRFTNAYVVMFTSDLLGTAAVDAALKTVTLTDTATYDWPDNAVDWFISFEQDDYTLEYLVTSRTADTLVYSDGGNTSGDAAASKWELRGYPKDEILNLLNFCLHYTVFGQTQDVFNSADAGGVED